MKPPTPARDRRNGQILIVASCALLVLGIVAALALDVGYVCAAQARLQNASDAAVLAAAQKLIEARRQGTAESAARQLAATEAAGIVALNWNAARCEVAFGNYSDGQFVPQNADTQASAVQAKAYRDEVSPGGALGLFFAPLMGLSTVSLNARAVSDITEGISSISSDLRPFTIPESVLEGVEQGQTFVFTLPHAAWRKLYTDEEYAPGNFGLLNLDGGPQGTPELVQWIDNGYPGEISIDPAVGYVWIGGTNGVVASTQDDIRRCIGKLIFICVHDQCAGEGANAQFRIVWFAAVTILDVQFTGTPKYVTLRYERLSYVPWSETGGSGAGNLCKVQLVK